METTKNTTTPVAFSETKAVRSYFRNNARFGRTTTLIVCRTGEKLGEYMGACTKSECYSSYVTALGR